MAARISLCMIVKNEADMLPRFLEAARGAWDELCVVDTGSSDETVPIVRSVGARVQNVPWTDDFSAARNASLRMATGDFILVLDADELVSPALVSEIREVTADPAVGAATVVMRNAMADGHSRDAHLVRLFRSDPSVCYEFPIHEDLTRSLAAHLQATGLTLVHLRGHVDHLGYVRAHAEVRGKYDRDRLILRRCVISDPGDLYSWFKLLELARFWNDPAALTATAAEAAVALKKADPKILRAAHFGGELVVLLADGLHGGDRASALAFLDTWVDRVAPAAELFMKRGDLHADGGAADLAAADYTRCLDLAPQTRNIQFATVRPLLGLVRLALAAHDFQTAWQRTQEALEYNPRDREALLSALFICLSSTLGS